MTKEIPLTKGYVALVDDEDYEWLTKWKWVYHSAGYACYTARKGDNRAGKTILMHREIAEVHSMVSDGQTIDHCDGDRLNNTKLNLRAATPAQNSANQSIRPSNKSGYKNVHYNKEYDLWGVQIMVSFKLIGLGFYKDVHHAALIANAAMKFYHGEFARLNTIPAQYIVPLESIPLPKTKPTSDRVRFIIESVTPKVFIQLPLFPSANHSEIAS